MNYTELLTKLGIASFPPIGEEVFSSAMAEYDANGCRWVSESFLQEMDGAYGMFRNHRDFIFRTAADIRGNELLSRFTVLLAAALKRDKAAFSSDSTWTLPVPADGEAPEPSEMTGYFALLAQMPASAETMKRWGLPEDVMCDTLAAITGCISIFMGYEHRPGYNAGRVRWAIHYMEPEILRIGRLEFQFVNFRGQAHLFRNAAGENRILMASGRFHRSGVLLDSPGFTDTEGAFDADFVETNEYWEGCPTRPDGTALSERIQLAKSEWKLMLSPGDQALSIHIPGMIPLLHEQVEDAYRRARELVARCRPDFDTHAMVCFSWLMDPKLQTMLREDANIAKFQRDFMAFPSPAGGSAVYSFLFHMPGAKPEDLPADTSLRRKVKDLILSGGNILEIGGIVKPEVSGIL